MATLEMCVRRESPDPDGRTGQQSSCLPLSPQFVLLVPLERIPREDRPELQRPGHHLRSIERVVRQRQREARCRIAPSRQRYRKAINGDHQEGGQALYPSTGSRIGRIPKRGAPPIPERDDRGE